MTFGAGASGMLELRFMSAVADIQNGDRLVTSGIDGTYPAGLPVANVVRIERDVDQTFARAVCQPVAGIERGRYVLVLANESARPPLPEDAGRERARKSKPRFKKDAKEADAAS